MKLSLHQWNWSILFVLLFFVFSCETDEDQDPTNDPSTTTEIGYQSGVLIDTHFRGVVSDENGAPLADVIISIGTSSTLTDSEGYWQILDASVDSVRAFIKAEKDGYFAGSRVLRPYANNFNRAFITLFELENTGSVSASAGGTVVHSSGASVALPADAIVDQNGDLYNGQVFVSICHIDPSNDGFMEEMPGDLTAFDESGNFRALYSYGMIGVELHTSTGEELAISDSSMATITIPLPNGPGPSAPNTIPLWHFDEGDGVWKEEGHATLVGTEYIGDVSHFSFWNCDVPAPYVFVEGSIIGQITGLPTQGIRVNVISDNYGLGTGYTNEQGVFGGLMPANELLTLEVIYCGSVLLSLEVGPFSDDATIPPIEIIENQIGYITGTLIGCDIEPISGYVTINNSSMFPETIHVGPDGQFLFNVNCAPQTLSIYAYDENYQTASLPQEEIVQANETIDIGNLYTCSVSAQEYLEMNINGTTHVISDSLYGLFSVNTVWIEGTSLANNTYVSITMDDTTDPALMNEESFINIDGTEYWASENVSTIFTSYSQEVGAYLEFDFSGIFEIDGSSGQEQFISGSGRIQRQ